MKLEWETRESESITRHARDEMARIAIDRVLASIGTKDNDALYCYSGDRVISVFRYGNDITVFDGLITRMFDTTVEKINASL